MKWRRKPNVEQIGQWLDSGSPARVERWLDDPAVAAILERLSELDPEKRLALHDAIAPSVGFEERTAQGVRSRVDDLERLGVLFGLLALGPRAASALLDPDAD